MSETPRFLTVVGARPPEVWGAYSRGLSVNLSLRAGLRHASKDEAWSFAETLSVELGCEVRRHCPTCGSGRSGGHILGGCPIDRALTMLDDDGVAQ